MATKTEVWKHLATVVVYRATAELRAESKRTYAGILWWVIQPIMTFGVYYLAFKWVMPQKDNFALFLFTGICVWQWFLLSTLRASTAIVAANALTQRVNLHKIVFPASVVLVNTIKFALVLAVLFTVLIIGGVYPSIEWAALIPVMFVLLVTILGVGCAISAVAPFFPDLTLVFATTLHLLFFLSGIIYDLSNLPPDIAELLYLNPLAVIIDETRHILLDHQWPDWARLLQPTLVGATLLAAAVLVINRFDKVYPKYG